MTEFCGLRLATPVINASGTFDAIAARRVYGEALLEEFPFSAFVSKTITLEPRAGNEPQRIWETPAGMINSIGLPNKGLEGFIAEDLPQLGELPVPLVVSVMATGREGFGRMVSALTGRDEVAAFELNVSCPNVHSGLIVGEQPAETAALAAALRPLTAKPLIVKLTPNVADPAAVAVAAEEGGADAVSLINTLKASGGPVSGGLSGPARLGIDVRVVADHGNTGAGQGLEISQVEVGDDQLRLLHRGLPKRRGKGDLVTGCAERRVHLAAKQEIGGDGDDPGHYRARRSRNSSRTLSGRPHICTTSARPSRTSRSCISPLTPSSSSVSSTPMTVSAAAACPKLWATNSRHCQSAFE